jgi:MFS superfamily sulfate permease-like transporter
LEWRFAIASGVKPEYGIYTTIVAGILISIFGGSKFQIAGPTGAFIPVLLGVVMTYGYENLLIAGFMAGVMLLLMGIFRLGSLIKYIPRPVTIGFTAGIAVIIFTGQIASFLGLTGIKKHEEFIANIGEIIRNIETINVYSVITAVICLVTIVLWGNSCNGSDCPNGNEYQKWRRFFNVRNHSRARSIIRISPFCSLRFPHPNGKHGANFNGCCLEYE